MKIVSRENSILNTIFRHHLNLKLILTCKLNQRLGQESKAQRDTCGRIQGLPHFGRRKQAQDSVFFLTELQPMRLAANIPEQEWEIKRFWRQQYWWKIANPGKRAIIYCFLILGVSTRCFGWENCRAATQIVQQRSNTCNWGNLRMSQKTTDGKYPSNGLLSIASRRRFYWGFGRLECFQKIYLCIEHEKRNKQITVDLYRTRKHNKDWPLHMQ